MKDVQRTVSGDHPKPLSMPIALALLGVMLVTAAIAAPYGIISSVWVGGEVGNWSEPTNWDPEGVPDNDDIDVFAVTIDGNGAQNAIVSLDQNATINELNVDADDELQIQSGFTLGINGGPVVNHGLVNVNSSNGAVNSFLHLTGDTTLEGTGEVLLNGQGFRSQITAEPDVTLTNAVDHTIRGRGRISAAMINEGEIVSDTGSLNLVDNDKVNVGEIRVDGPFQIFVEGITINQEPSGAERGLLGAMTARQGAIILLDTVLCGGILRSEDGGSVSGGGTNVLKDLINQSDYFASGGMMELAGFIINQLGITKGFGDFFVENATLENQVGAEIDLFGNNLWMNWVNFQNDGMAKLTDSTYMIQGGPWANFGTITAVESFGTHGDFDENRSARGTGDCENFGIIEFCGGEFDFFSGTWRNKPDGEIKAKDAAVIRMLAGQLFNNGKLSALDAAAFIIGTESTGMRRAHRRPPNRSGPEFVEFIHDGVAQAESGGRFVIFDDIEGTGEWLIDGGELIINEAIVTTTGPVTVLNGGAVEINGGTMHGSDLTLDETSSIAVASGFELTGNLSFAMSDESLWSWSGISTLAMNGGGGSSVGAWENWARLEIGGEDLGDVPGGFEANFDLGHLQIGPGARVYLEELIDNGNRLAGVGDSLPEALYVDTLEFVDGAGILNVNGLNIYYNTLIGDESQIINLDINAIPGDVNGDGVVNVLDLLEVIANWGTDGSGGGDANDDGVVNVLDLLLVIANWGAGS